MITFDPSKVTFEFVKLKTVTMAIGGSISVVDEGRSTPKSEVLQRIEVPLACVRQFIKQTKKVTRYLKPVYVCLMRYESHVVAMERHPLGVMGKLEETIDGKTRTWTPTCELKYKLYVLPLVRGPIHGSATWFFDGRFVFSFDHDDEKEIAERSREWLTSDGKFRKVKARSVDLQALSLMSYKVEPTERSCLAFVSSRGVVSISPPIWKDVADVGLVQLGRAAAVSEDADDEDDTGRKETATKLDYSFDRINEDLAVNLSFALKAGTEIGKTFGYEYVEPLHLPRLMIELHTVNLPSVPKEVKSTYDINLPFTHALAWLLGLARRANTLDTYIMMRSLMKYLTKRGIFRSNVFNAGAIYLPNKSSDDVKLVPIDKLLKETTTELQMLDDLLKAARVKFTTRNGSSDNTTFGGLINEE